MTADGGSPPAAVGWRPEQSERELPRRETLEHDASLGDGSRRAARAEDAPRGRVPRLSSERAHGKPAPPDRADRRARARTSRRTRRGPGRATPPPTART